MKRTVLGFCLMLLACTGQAWAATAIYRSIGPENTSVLDSGSPSHSLTLNSGTATFSSALPLYIGVGDVLLYDSDGDSVQDACAFIHRRNSSQSFVVRDAAGATPANSASGDPTWEIYRAYTALAYAESGDENPGIPAAFQDFDYWSGGRDLVANNEVWNLACYADAPDTVYTNVQGWTTGPANYIKIYTPYLPTDVGASQRHNGTWSSGAYMMEVTTDNPLDITQACVRVEGIQFHWADIAHDGWPEIWIPSTGSGMDIRISHCIFRGLASGTIVDNHALEITDSDGGDGDVKIWNNLFYDFAWDPSVGAVYVHNPNVNVYFYNNTLDQCDAYGIWRETGVVTVKNNVVQNSSDGYTGTFDPASDYNLSDLAGDAPGANAKNSTTVSFVNPAVDNYHLQPGDTGARDSGTNLSGDAYLPFADDIDNQARSGTWDMGADEVIGVPTFTPTRTPTRTATRTPTRTATRTATPTATWTATPTITPTPTLSPSSTETPYYSPTATPTRTATPTITPTRTASASSTETPFYSPTFTQTRTPSPTLSATRTPTFTRTPSATNTPTRTQTSTFTTTLTSTFSSTPTMTPTLTESATYTVTRTVTPTRTATLTSTISPTPTITRTRTQSPTITITSTPSPTRTITLTRTPVAFVVQEVVVYPQPTTGDVLFFYYPLAEPGEVEIEIFNVVGERAAYLRESKAGVGYERTQWSIQNAAPGVYMYRVRIKTATAETVTPIKKLMITKIRK
jgi:hypothetical protein